MKVKITDEAKKWLTVAELPIAKQIVKDMKDEEWDAADALKTAADCWLHNSGQNNDYAGRVLDVSAEIAGNSRIYNAYGDGSGRLDVWLTGTVETWDGFLKIGAYLTDIWNIGAEGFNEQFPAYTYTRYYKEV